MSKGAEPSPRQQQTHSSGKRDTPFPESQGAMPIGFQNIQTLFRGTSRAPSQSPILALHFGVAKARQSRDCIAWRGYSQLHASWPQRAWPVFATSHRARRQGMGRQARQIPRQIRRPNLPSSARLAQLYGTPLHYETAVFPGKHALHKDYVQKKRREKKDFGKIV